MGLFRRDPMHDVTSISHLLRETEMCTQEQIDAAIAFRETHPDVMLGEALIRLKALTRDQLEIVLARQEILRSHGSGKCVNKLANLATERMKRTSMRMDRLLSQEEKLAIK